MWCVARSAILLEPHVVDIHIIHFRSQEVTYRSVALAVVDYGNARFGRSTDRWFRQKNQNPHQTVTFPGCIWSWCISHGLISSQIRQFCLFTYPFIQKWASSLKMICLAKFGLTSNCFRTQSANTRRCLWSFTFSSWVSWILYCRPKSRRKIR